MTPHTPRSTRPPPAPDPAALGEANEPLPITREELEVLVHDLRNHLNSLLMNAAVIASACPDRARLGHFIDQVERDGERCAEALQRVADRHLSPAGEVLAQ